MERVDDCVGGIAWMGGVYLKDLDYADDVCLIGDNVENIENVTRILAQEAQKVGLAINIDK